VVVEEEEGDLEDLIVVEEEIIMDAVLLLLEMFHQLNMTDKKERLIFVNFIPVEVLVIMDQIAGKDLFLIQDEGLEGRKQEDPPEINDAFSSFLPI
jgi:hypothetical protein